MKKKTESEKLEELFVSGTKDNITNENWIISLLSSIASSLARIADNFNGKNEEIIRCRDCKYWGEIGCAIYIVDDSDKPKENDFCSFAERLEDENGH